MLFSEKISCPKCDHKFALNESLSHDIEESFKKRLQEEISKKENALKEQIKMAQQVLVDSEKKT